MSTQKPADGLFRKFLCTASSLLCPPFGEAVANLQQISRITLNSMLKEKAISRWLRRVIRKIIIVLKLRPVR